MRADTHVNININGDEPRAKCTWSQVGCCSHEPRTYSRILLDLAPAQRHETVTNTTKLVVSKTSIINTEVSLLSINKRGRSAKLSYRFQPKRCRENQQVRSAAVTSELPPAVIPKCSVRAPIAWAVGALLGWVQRRPAQLGWAD